MLESEGNGSTFWFFIAPQSSAEFIEYFRKKNIEVDREATIASINDLLESGCDVYIAEQKPGNLLLIPPNSYHQRINSCGLTIRMGWAQMTLRSLQRVLHGVLDGYRR